MQNNIPILCTRPLPASLIEEAAAAGITIDTLSFIETESIASVEVQQEVELASTEMATVIFTSANAVEAVAGFLENHQPDWRIYSIGSATARLVKEYFGEHTLAGTAADAASLAALIVEEEETGEVIFFCGDQRRDELPEILGQHDIELNEIVVYQTVATPRKITKEYFGILFFSPSAVESFFSLNTVAEKALLFAIGNTTAAAISRYCSNKVIVSAETSRESLVATAVEYFS